MQIQTLTLHQLLLALLTQKLQQTGIKHIHLQQEQGV
jgi:hypothetical protein